MNKLNEEIVSITLKYPDGASELANKELKEKWDDCGVKSGDTLIVNQSELKGTDDKYYPITKIEKSPDSDSLIVRTDLQDTNSSSVVLVIGNGEYRLNK